MVHVDQDIYNPERVQVIAERVMELVEDNRDTAPNRAKTKDIMDGGTRGLSRLVGKDISTDEAADMIPAANLMLKANERLAQKIGRYPFVKVDADRDSETAQERADKRVRIQTSYDRACRMRLQLRQLGRWLPGYGFGCWTVSLRNDVNGDPYPHASLRDPFNTYLAPWTVDQSPRDVAFLHTIQPKDLKRINEDAYNRLVEGGKPNTAGSSVDFLPRAGGGVLLGGGFGASGAGRGGTGQPSWANQSGDGIDVYEYISDQGTYWILPGYEQVLSYTPNPLTSRPPFAAVKRFSFNKLQGQYDQLVGLMAAVARMNLLTIMAAEDGINSETNVIGQMAHGKYVRGRRATNYLMPGSTVAKMNDRIPFEVLQQADKMERQMRSMATYPVTDDAISPNSFVTGMGLEELKGSVELEVEEYHEVTSTGVEEVDAMRFEMAESLMGDQTLKMQGTVKGAGYSESYKPSTHINGHRATRRIYGMLSTWDDPNKIVTGMAMLQNEIIDEDTLRENVDGLEDHERIKERTKHKKVDDAMMARLMAGAQEGDPTATEALIELLPDGDEKELYRRLFIERPREQARQQAEAERGSIRQGVAGGGSDVPPTTTVLNRLTNRSAPTVGVQTVQQRQ